MNRSASNARPDEFTPAKIEAGGKPKDVQWSFATLDLTDQTLNIPANIKIRYQDDGGKPHAIVYEPTGESKNDSFDTKSQKTYAFSPVSVDGQRFDAGRNLVDVQTGKPSAMPKDEAVALFKAAPALLDGLSKARIFDEVHLTISSLDNLAATSGAAPRVSCDVRTVMAMGAKP